jgi:hypothetical protein
MSRKRSKAYPAHPLQDAIGFLRRIDTNLGKNTFPREMLAKALGHGGKSGPAARKVASMCHFGLLDRNKGQYTPSQLGLRLLQEESPVDLRAAFLTPPLYQEIYDKYRATDNRVPALLAEILVAEHGISEAAKADADAAFRSSGLYAGVLDEGGRILDGQPNWSSSSAHVDEAPEHPVANSGREPLDGQRAPYHIPLSGGRIAELSVPFPLNQIDIKLLKGYVDLLEQSVESGAPPTKVVPFRRPQ